MKTLIPRLALILGLFLSACAQHLPKTSQTLKPGMKFPPDRPMEPSGKGTLELFRSGEMAVRVNRFREVELCSPSAEGAINPLKPHWIFGGKSAYSALEDGDLWLTYKGDRTVFSR